MSLNAPRLPRLALQERRVEAWTWHKKGPGLWAELGCCPRSQPNAQSPQGTEDRSKVSCRRRSRLKAVFEMTDAACSLLHHLLTLWEGVSRRRRSWYQSACRGI